MLNLFVFAVFGLVPSLAFAGDITHVNNVGVVAEQAVLVLCLIYVCVGFGGLFYLRRKYARPKSLVRVWLTFWATYILGAFLFMIAGASVAWFFSWLFHGEGTLPIVISGFINLLLIFVGPAWLAIHTTRNLLISK